MWNEKGIYFSNEKEFGERERKIKTMESTFKRPEKKPNRN